MITCPYCGYKEREGVLFCEECGQSLQKPIEQTITITPTRRLEDSPQNVGIKATWGTARFGQDAFIIIHVRDAPDPIVTRPTPQVILGRSDSSSLLKPDLDLTPYGALEKGVSRQHATICRNDDTLTVIDMGSANGTHLNGQRLIPNQPRVVRDGDEIRLGKLVAHIYFK